MFLITNYKWQEERKGKEQQRETERSGKEAAWDGNNRNEAKTKKTARWS